MSKRINRARFAPLLTLAFMAFGFVAGCAVTPWRATPFRAPADVAHLRLERQDSVRIIVDKIWLERNEEGLFVTGYVMSRMSVDDTMGSHLIVSLRDASGTELRSTPIDFSPRQVPRQRRPSAVSRYRSSLDPLPADTATIVVTAQDDRPST